MINKYTGINKFPLNEQTAATDNLLSEIKSVLGSNVAFPHLTRWIPLIEDTNNQFKDVTSDSITERAKLKNTEAASYVAPQLTEELQNLYTLMFAFARIGDNDQIVKAYKELEVLIASVNYIINLFPG